MSYKKLLVLTCTALLISSAPAFAKMGTESGGGGGAFVCRNSSGKILSAELVDIYEAKNQLGLKIKNLGDMDLESQVELVQLKAYKADDAGRTKNFGAKLSESLDRVRKIMRMVDDVVLENTNDFQITISPKTCAGGKIKFEQLAHYTPTEELIVDQEIYNSLSTTNKAALELHEALYLMARETHGSVSSLEARRAVGYLLSIVEGKDIPTSVLSLQPAGGAPNKKWKCSATFLYKSCLSSGCSDEEARKNDAKFYGKSLVDVTVMFNNLSQNNSSFTACKRWTNDKFTTTDSSDSNYHLFRKIYVCTELATVENSCFQQF